MYIPYKFRILCILQIYISFKFYILCILHICSIYDQVQQVCKFPIMQWVWLGKPILEKLHSGKLTKMARLDGDSILSSQLEDIKKTWDPTNTFHHCQVDPSNPYKKIHNSASYALLLEVDFGGGGWTEDKTFTWPSKKDHNLSWQHQEDIPSFIQKDSLLDWSQLMIGWSRCIGKILSSYPSYLVSPTCTPRCPNWDKSYNFTIYRSTTTFQSLWYLVSKEIVENWDQIPFTQIEENLLTH